MRNLILGSLLLFSNIAFGARLEDVKVLNVTPGAETFELKLQIKEGPKDSYFIVDITKNDPESFEKIALVVKKLKLRDKFKLNLDIPSFSASPSGSYYKSEGISFYDDSADREPDSVKKKKKELKK